MKDFYCHDMYWLVAIDGLERALFQQEKEARQFFWQLDPVERDGDVSLWRLNGGFLCTPAVCIKTVEAGK